MSEVSNIINKSERIDYFDGWRGLAITLVLVAHFYDIPEFLEGSLGVDLFFALSGLLMANILFVKKTPLKKFYKHRISRIIPLAFLYLVFAYVTTRYFNGVYVEKIEIISSFLFLRTYIPSSPDIWHSSLPLAGHYWSLNVEEHCYILMGLMTLFIRDSKKAGYMLIGLGIAATVTSLYYEYAILKPALFKLHTECASAPLLFSAGFFLVKKNFDNWYHPILPLIAILFAIFAYSSFSPSWAIYIAPFLLAYVINNIEKLPQTVHAVLSYKALRYLGIWSFSIYIWQEPFYLNYDFFGIYSLVLAIALSIISFYFFENPVRSWLNRIW